MTISCVIVDDDPISLRLLEGMVEQTDFLTLTKSFQNSVEAVQYLRENETDLLLLDVEMPEMTGLEMLGTFEHKPAVILVSAKADYAIDAFQFDVDDYLLKPPTYARFLKAVQKVQEKLNQDQALQFKGDFVFVKSDTALVKVDIRQVQWIEALADYVAIVTKEKKYVCHSTMKSIESKLPAEQFVRVHWSYIVRIDQIDAIEDKTITVAKKIIPVGGTYRDSLMNRLNLI